LGSICWRRDWGYSVKRKINKRSIDEIEKSEKGCERHSTCAMCAPYHQVNAVGENLTEGTKLNLFIKL